MKFVYDQQPLGVRLNQRSNLTAIGTADRCPCCSDHREDQIHFLCCSANPSQSGALNEFQKKMHWKDLHAIFYLLSFGIQFWFQGQVPSAELWDLRGYPSHMHSGIIDALQDQAQIGWLACLKGFLSLQWSKVASMSMTDADALHSDAGARRLCHILIFFHDLTKAIWLGRNECMHKVSNRETLRLTRVEDLEIQHYYEQPELHSSDDRHYCDRTLSSILKSTPATRRRWLRQVKKARHHRQRELRSQSLLPQFFPRLLSSELILVPPASSGSQVPPTENIPTVSVSTIPLPPPAPHPRQRSILDFFVRRNT